MDSQTICKDSSWEFWREDLDSPGRCFREIIINLAFPYLGFFLSLFLVWIFPHRIILSDAKGSFYNPRNYVNEAIRTSRIEKLHRWKYFFSILMVFAHVVLLYQRSLQSFYDWTHTITPIISICFWIFFAYIAYQYPFYHELPINLTIASQIFIQLINLYAVFKNNGIYYEKQITSFLLIVSVIGTIYMLLIPSKELQVTDGRYPSPEHAKNLFQRIYFSWMNGIIRKGVEKHLEETDLWNLPKDDQARVAWSNYKLSQNPYSSLFPRLFYHFRYYLIKQAIFQLTYCICLFSGPFFLQRILEFIESPDHSKIYIAYFYVISLLVGSLISSAANQQSLFLGRHIGFQIKALLIGELTQKAIQRNPNLSDSKSQGLGDGKIMNLLSNDVLNVSWVSSYLDGSYGAPIQLFIGLFLLFNLVGVSALAGLLVLISTYPLNHFCFSFMDRIMEKIKSIVDERLSKLDEVFQGIKIIKLFGWENNFLRKINDVRETQLSYSRKLVFVWATFSSLLKLSPVLVMLSTLLVFTKVFGHQLNASIAFTSISLFKIIRESIDFFPGYINWLISGKVSLERVERFFKEEEIEDLHQRAILSPMESNDINTLQFSTSSSPNSSVSSTDLTLPLKDPFIGFTNASFSWISESKLDDRNKNFSLKNLHLSFPRNELSLIIGSTGAGKSSLILALLGEMPRESGGVFLPLKDGKIHSVAYVSQESWLRNTTIRENILFLSPYDNQRYERVLKACSLFKDLRQFAAGDQTEIGEKGVNMSGGQKQRIALARAIYSSAETLILDDCFSAIDSHTIQYIFEQCFQSDLMQNRTCILVTHHYHLFLPLSSYLVIMNNGSILYSDHPQNITDPSLLDDFQLDYSLKQRTSKSDNKTHPDDEELKQDSDESKGKLIEEENRQFGKIQFKVYKTYLKAAKGYLYWLVALFVFILCQMSDIAQDYWFRYWASTNASQLLSMFQSSVFFTQNSPVNFHYYDRLNTTHAISPLSSSVQSSASHPVEYYLGVYALLGLVSLVFNLCQIFIVFFASIHASRILHDRLLKRILYAKPRFFDSTPMGRIMNRFSKDMKIVDDDLADNIDRAIQIVITTLSIIGVITFVTPKFIIAAIVITIIYIIIGYRYVKASRELRRLEAITFSPLISLFKEILQGSTLIRSFGKEKDFIDMSMDRIDRNTRPFYLVWAANRWLGVRMELFGSFISFFSGIFILLNLDTLDAGLAGFSLSYALIFSNSIMWIVRNYGDLELNMNSVERIQEFMEIEQEAPFVIEKNRPPAHWPSQGVVQVDNLVLQYAPSLPPVIKGITFDVSSGEKVAIVGRTGAGKSTLSLALLRFIEATSGHILIDGIDISRLGLEDLRKRITIIPQDPVLFNGSIRFNLDPFDEYDDALIWEALRRAHLVDASVSSNPSSNQLSTEEATNDSTFNQSTNPSDSSTTLAGSQTNLTTQFTNLDMQISENGSNLSLGQRQLVALARALVRKSKVIIMDEATASVDHFTDAKIQRTIREEFTSSTLLCIAHRLRTIIDYDRVLVLDGGMIAEYDTPYNLIHSTDSLFHKLCKDSGELELLIKLAKERVVTEF